MQKGWFRMRDESTTTPESGVLSEQPAQGRRRGRPKGSKPQKKRGNLLVPTEDATMEAEQEEEAWGQRGRHWEGANRSSPSPPKTQRRRKAERESLVLAGHGVRLRVHQGSLVVLNGFTHYPQEREELRFFPGDRKLPSRIVALDSDGSITLDVMKWLSRQGVPLVMVDWRGEVVSVVGDGGAYDPALREAQLAAQGSELGLHIAIELIERKIRGSIDTLESLPSSLVRSAAIEQLVITSAELQGTPPENVQQLLLVEAQAAYVYFSCWRMLKMRWKGTGRKPIPSEWHSMGLRQSMYGSGNRNATHPVNAMLNYAYAVLESQVRIATLVCGLDPTIGYLHTCRTRRVALVYDLMEPLRPQVDCLILGFMLSHTFHPNDFVLSFDGICRLHPQLAKQVARLTVGELRVQEVVAWTGARVRDFMAGRIASPPSTPCKSTQ